MRRYASEDMSQQELDVLEFQAMNRNPHRHCTCNRWNNDDGICSYCELEEEKDEDETTDDC
jgi:hypothetical protein